MQYLEYGCKVISVKGNSKENSKKKFKKFLKTY
nr:hypothetical protein CoNPh38_CDS0303 [Staphylococcus phage S-CoN_Ph38]